MNVSDSQIRQPSSDLRGTSRLSAAIHFCLFTTLSVTAGFAPLILFLGKPKWLIWPSAMALLISFAVGWRVDPANERPLIAREAVVVLFGSVSDASMIGILLFLLYGVFWICEWLIGLIGWSGAWVSWVGNLIVGGCVAFFSLGTTATTAEKLRTLLFPSWGIGNAPLVPDLGPGQVSPKALLATLVLIALICLSIFVSAYFLIALQIYMAMTSLKAAQSLRRRRFSSRNLDLRTGIKKMLRALGYVVVDRLQTGQLKMDRLISVFDIVAHAGGYALAIQLKTEEEGASPVGWAEAGYLKSATRPVYSALKNSHESVHNVLPMLVLCGRSFDDSLMTFAQEESIIVAKTDWATILSVAGDKLSEGQIREIAQSQLGIRPAHRPAEVAV